MSFVFFVFIHLLSFPSSFIPRRTDVRWRTGSIKSRRHCQKELSVWISPVSIFKKKKKKFCRRMTHTKGEGRFICIKIYILQIGWQRIKKRRKKGNLITTRRREKNLFYFHSLGKYETSPLSSFQIFYRLVKEKATFPFSPNFHPVFPTHWMMQIWKRERCYEKKKQESKVRLETTTNKDQVGMIYQLSDPLSFFFCVFLYLAEQARWTEMKCSNLLRVAFL